MQNNIPKRSYEFVNNYLNLIFREFYLLPRVPKTNFIVSFEIKMRKIFFNETFGERDVILHNCAIYETVM